MFFSPPRTSLPKNQRRCHTYICRRVYIIYILYVCIYVYNIHIYYVCIYVYVCVYILYTHTHTHIIILLLFIFWEAPSLFLCMSVFHCGILGTNCDNLYPPPLKHMLRCKLQQLHPQQMSHSFWVLLGVYLSLLGLL